MSSRREVSNSEGKKVLQRKGKMKIGFLTEYSEERVEFAKKAGFDCLEVSVTPGSALDVRNLTKEKIERIRKVFTRNEVKISDLACYFLNHLDPDEKKRKENNEYFISVLKISKEFGTNIVTTNTWGDRTRPPKENLSLYKKVFSEYAKIAEDNGVRIAMENCPHINGYPFSIGNIGYSPSIWKLLFEAVPSLAIGLQYDPSHLVWLGIDYLRGIYDFKERIYSVHAKDTEIIKNNLYKEGILGTNWWRYRLPGLGEINWQKFLGALYDIGYQGDIIIELEDPVFCRDRIDEGLKLGLKYLRLFVL